MARKLGVGEEGGKRGWAIRAACERELGWVLCMHVLGLGVDRWMAGGLVLLSLSPRGRGGRVGGGGGGSASPTLLLTR